MKKLILGGGILGSLAVAVLFVWMLIVGAKSLWENTPMLFDGGKRIVTEIVRKADNILPGVKEGIDQVAPGVVDKVKNLIPGADIPTKDVGGEDIGQIPRHTSLIRVSYWVDNQRRTVIYRGKVDMGTVIDFYRRELVRLGHIEEVVSTSVDHEVYRFRKGAQGLSFIFRKISSIPSQITEVTIKEI